MLKKHHFQVVSDDILPGFIWERKCDPSPVCEFRGMVHTGSSELWAARHSWETGLLSTNNLITHQHIATIACSSSSSISSSHLFDKMPSQAVIGGKFQANLSVNVRGRLSATAHDQWELDHIGRSDLHGLRFHIANTGGCAVITWETERTFTSVSCTFILNSLTAQTVCNTTLFPKHSEGLQSNSWSIRNRHSGI